MDAKTARRERFAIYARYSSEMQNELSIEAQIEQCKQEIGKRGGVVVDIFHDSARSGWSLDRDGFNNLRIEAARNRFDAIMFWKFDRLARNHDHAVMIKMMLRNDFQLSLYCVEGFSEDDDNSPYTAMMEQILAVISAYYSKNLSSETKRGKKQRVLKGLFNGSIAPLGYILSTLKDPHPSLAPGLHVDPEVASIVIRAFELYATGKYSDRDIATWMNEQSVIQSLRASEKPIGKEMIRDLLQNRVYTGRVPYSNTEYSRGFGQGKKSSRHRKEWFEGIHEAIISDELYDLCQDVRKKNTKYRIASGRMRTYILHDRVYCTRCAITKPNGLNDELYGKMRPKFSVRDNMGAYWCLSHHRGYKQCGQRGIRIERVDEQVLDVLYNLNIPEGFTGRVEQAVRNKIEHEAAFKRMEEIKQIMQNMDIRWDKGFVISADEYFQQREQLQREFDALRPVDYDNLMEAADLLKNFRIYWNDCKTLEKPEEAQQQLVQKLVHQVYVYDQKVVAIALHGDFRIILDQVEAMPEEVKKLLASEAKMVGNITENVTNQNGSDGIRTRDLHLDRVAC